MFGKFLLIGYLLFTHLHAAENIQATVNDVSAMWDFLGSTETETQAARVALENSLPFNSLTFMQGNFPCYYINLPDQEESLRAATLMLIGIWKAKAIKGQTQGKTFNIQALQPDGWLYQDVCKGMSYALGAGNNFSPPPENPKAAQAALLIKQTLDDVRNSFFPTAASAQGFQQHQPKPSLPASVATPVLPPLKPLGPLVTAEEETTLPTSWTYNFKFTNNFGQTQTKKFALNILEDLNPQEQAYFRMIADILLRKVETCQGLTEGILKDIFAIITQAFGAVRYQPYLKPYLQNTLDIAYALDPNLYGQKMTIDNAERFGFPKNGPSAMFRVDEAMPSHLFNLKRIRFFVDEAVKQSLFAIDPNYGRLSFHITPEGQTDSVLIPGFELDVGSFITQCEAALMLVAQRIKQITMCLKQLETINPQYAENLWKEFLMFGFTIGCTQATVTKLDDFINSGSPSNIEKNVNEYTTSGLTGEDLEEYLTSLKAKHAFYKILFPKSKNIIFQN